jgi:type IV pilus assembly protein PilO
VNALIERLLELPPRQRILAIVGAVAAVVLLYAYFLYWPREAQIEEKTKQVENLRRDRDRKAALVGNIEAARKEVQKLDGDLRAAVAQLPDTKEIPELLSAVSSLGIESGLEIVQFKQREEEYADFYARVPVDIVVRGTFHQVVSFFDKVGRMPRIVNVSEVSIKAPQRIEGNEVLLDTSCAAVTFRFLDDAERERLAKQRDREKGGKP